MSEIILTIDGVDPVELFGQNNSKLNLLRESFPEVTITSRGNSLKLIGEKKHTQKAKAKFEMLVRILREQKELPTQVVKDILNGRNPFENKISLTEDNKVIVYGRGGKPIRAKTRNQKMLVHSVENNDVVFAVGPAGTGKTYISVALAVKALKNKQVKKIIITRPAVEAGETLGFLPGDLKEKLDPYLRPIYDALHDMVPSEKLKYYMENNIVEIAPLAYMRGRTLNNAFILLDEAQNTTPMQIKMFLTRMGPNSKVIVTGDTSQIDLPKKQKSGLIEAVKVLKDVNGIGFINLTGKDVIRHRIVKDIITAYDDHENSEQE